MFVLPVAMPRASSPFQTRPRYQHFTCICTVTRRIRWGGVGLRTVYIPPYPWFKQIRDKTKLYRQLLTIEMNDSLKHYAVQVGRPDEASSYLSRYVRSPRQQDPWIRENIRRLSNHADFWRSVSDSSFSPNTKLSNLQHVPAHVFVDPLQQPGAQSLSSADGSVGRVVFWGVSGKGRER